MDLNKNKQNIYVDFLLTTGSHLTVKHIERK